MLDFSHLFRFQILMWLSVGKSVALEMIDILRSDVKDLSTPLCLLQQPALGTALALCPWLNQVH